MGPSALSDAELVAILLGTGSSDGTALELAQKMLVRSEAMYGTGLAFLSESVEEEIREIPGIGPAKAARLRACVEIGKRLLRDREMGGRRQVISCGQDTFNYIRGAVSDLDREHFYILHLNSRCEVMDKEIVSIGSLDATIVHPREIFKNSIRKSAAYIVLVHNHPSGDPEPSDDDIRITKRLLEAGKLLGIHVADHVIIARGSYVSVRDTYPGLFS